MPRGGRGGGARRMVAGGELRLVLLSLIARGPRHGYDLIRAIDELSGGAYAPSPGVIYPALAMLEDLGHIAAQAQDGGGRKAFAVTPDGEAELAARASEVRALAARLSALGRGQDERSLPVRRAMDNLKAVLGPALDRLQAEQAHDIAAIIDEAARTIERLG